MDFPSTLLRAIGIFLIVIGLSGTLGGLFALNLIQKYDFGSMMPETVESSLSNMTVRLEDSRRDVNVSITNSVGDLKDASQSIESASTDVQSASNNVDAASKNLTGAADDLKAASSNDKDAAVYLRDASNGLNSWADDYSLNGTPLPSKSAFQTAVDKIKTASDKIEASGEKLESTSNKLRSTSTCLQETSADLKSSSENLRDVGTDLRNTSENLLDLKNPLEGIIGDVSTPLRDVESSVKTVTGFSSNIQVVAYLLVGYLILLHLILLGIGIAFWIIEANLFYPVS